VSPKSLFENYTGCYFCAKGWMARRDEGEYPSWIFDRGATKPDGLWRKNPPGGGSFARGRCWLGHYSPLRGCAGLAALAAAKIPRRSASRSFQAGSKKMSFCSCRARLRGQNRRWWWFFLVTVLGMDIRLLADPALVNTNYPIEAHYSVAGPWEVSYGTHLDSSGNGYKLFYPAHLGTHGFKHPILTWGNGTYATPDLYQGILNQLASWGFVVIASTNPMTGTGAEMLAGVREMLRLNNSPSSTFYGKLDTNAIGALGHSQGAGGACRAAVNSNRLIKTAVLIDLPAQVWISKAADAFDPAQLTVPTLLLGGSQDWLVASPKILRDYYNAVPGQAALLILNGADHLVPQHSGGRYLGYLTAWMMCHLQGDHYARGAFAGTPAEANLNTNWSYQAVKNFP